METSPCEGRVRASLFASPDMPDAGPHQLLRHGSCRRSGGGKHRGRRVHNPYRWRHRSSAIGFGQERSEEHTSELQSLMRISYAVFCLKKKNNKNTHDKKSNTETLKQVN